MADIQEIGDIPAPQESRTEVPNAPQSLNPEERPDRKARFSRWAKRAERLFRVISLGATLGMAIATLYLAKMTWFQAEASRESIEQSHEALTKFDLALDKFAEELEIEKANRVSLERLSKSAKESVGISKTALGEHPEVASVDSRCPIEKVEENRFRLPNPSSCDYIKVVLRNPGKIQIQAHASLFFGALNLTCRSTTLKIGPLEQKEFAVHVAGCLPGTLPDAEVGKPLEFYVQSDLDDRK